MKVSPVVQIHCSGVSKGESGEGGGGFGNLGAPEILLWSPEAEASLYLVPRTKMKIPAKQRPEVKRWSSGAPGALFRLGALKPRSLWPGAVEP